MILLRDMIEYSNKKFELEEIETFIGTRFKPIVKCLALEVTKRCLFKCVHCYNQGLPTNKEMSYEEICSVLDQMSDLGAYVVKITGGEPLLRDDFWKIIKYAKKKGFAIELLTTAALITEEIAKKLADFYCQVYITIYGMSNKTYKLITGVEAFTRVRRAVEVMNKKRIPLTLKMVLLKDNFSDLPKLIKWQENMNITTLEICWRLSPSLKKDKMSVPFRYTLTKSQFEQLAERYPRYVFPSPRHVSYAKGHLPLCDLIIRGERLSVNAYGEVSPCIDIKNTTTFRDKPIKEIFLNDPWFVGFRKWTFKDASRCRNCSVVDYCRPCLGAFFLHTRKYGELRPSKEMCRNLRGWLLKKLHTKMIKHRAPVSSFSKCNKCVVDL